MFQCLPKDFAQSSPFWASSDHVTKALADLADKGKTYSVKIAIQIEIHIYYAIFKKYSSSWIYEKRII